MLDELGDSGHISPCRHPMLTCMGGSVVWEGRTDCSCRTGTTHWGAGRCLPGTKSIFWASGDRAQEILAMCPPGLTPTNQRVDPPTDPSALTHTPPTFETETSAPQVLLLRHSSCWKCHTVNSFFPKMDSDPKFLVFPLSRGLREEETACNSPKICRTGPD